MMYYIAVHPEPDSSLLQLKSIDGTVRNSSLFIRIVLSDRKKLSRLAELLSTVPNWTQRVESGPEYVSGKVEDKPISP